jgi:hypothetical protein
VILENCPVVNVVDNVNMVDSPDKPAKTKATVKSQKAVTKKVVP